MKEILVGAVAIIVPALAACLVAWLHRRARELERELHETQAQLQRERHAPRRGGRVRG